MSHVWCSRLRPTTGVHLAPCYDEFRGPRSDYVRQVALEATTTEFNESYSELVEYSYLALGYPFIPFSPEEVSLIVEISAGEGNLSAPASEFLKYLDGMDKEFQNLKNSSENFNLKEFVYENSVRCDDFFLYCIALVFPLNCCDIFRPVLTSMGLCYALRDHGEILQLIRQSPIEFSVIIDLVSPPHLSE
ncbi:UNVERIFIED_CONTAM: hypothetical protein NCL1_50068 [Trichonephila clavipes]